MEDRLMDFFFLNNCVPFPEMHGESQKQMNKTLHYVKFWWQQFHLQWDDWPEKQARLKDVSKAALCVLLCCDCKTHYASIGNNLG